MIRLSMLVAAAWATAVSNGAATAQTPTLVKDINTIADPFDGRPGNGRSSIYNAEPHGFVQVGGHWFFSARDATHGVELWKTDGSAAGTVRVADINPGAAHGSPIAFTVVGTTLFFRARTANTIGTEPYVSDGTVAGAQLIADSYPGLTSSFPVSSVTSSGRVFFEASHPTANRELHVWDPPLATAIEFGESCAPGFPSLHATAPVLGGATRFSGRGHGANPGMLVVNAPSPSAMVGGCTDYVRIPTAVFLAPVTGATYSFTQSIPNSPSLNGAEVYVQTWFITLPGVLPFQTSNGVEFVVGR